MRLWHQIAMPTVTDLLPAVTSKLTKWTAALDLKPNVGWISFSASTMSLLDPRTASFGQSIWLEIPEDTFRTHLVTLEERTNAVPVRPRTLDPVAQNTSTAWVTHILPLEVEQELADDIAYIAAVGEGAQSVSAVCLEEHHDPPSLCVRFAAVDTIDKYVRTSFHEVGCVLGAAASSRSDNECDNQTRALLNLIIKLHHQKLLGRLRSCKWQKPRYLARTHKKSLWQDFDNLIHRVQFVYPGKKDPKRTTVEAELHRLAQLLKSFESTPPETEVEFAQLSSIVGGCHHLCTSSSLQEFALKLESLPRATPQIAAAIKALRQLEKIGAYQRIAWNLVAAAKQYPSLLGNVRFDYLQPYSAIETDIGYESWAKTMHVHAEVQLVSYYDVFRQYRRLESDIGTKSCLLPRAIGTSKYLCFLCYLMLKHHDLFVPANTHGRLYDQWTIPDLANFNEKTRQQYRRIIRNMDDEVVKLSEELEPQEGKRDAWRVEPMTSRQNLLGRLTSGVTTGSNLDSG